MRDDPLDLDITVFPFKAKAQLVPDVLHQPVTGFGEINRQPVQVKLLEGPIHCPQQNFPLPQDVPDLAIKEDGMELRIGTQDDMGKAKQANEFKGFVFLPHLQNDVLSEDVLGEVTRGGVFTGRDVGLEVGPFGLVLNQAVEDVLILRGIGEVQRHRLEDPLASLDQTLLTTAS